jgi:CRISPR system Cascade subunit CasB
MTDPQPKPLRRATRELESAARGWWLALQPDPASGRTGDRAALARLRRYTTPIEAMTEPAVFDLFRRMGFTSGEAALRLPWVAVAAMVLAHARDDARESPARSVGRQNWQDEAFDTARMKPLRFQRLLVAREPEDLAREMRRLVALADRRINVGAQAVAILEWADPDRGDRLRARWAFDYHAAGDAAPEVAADPAPREPDTTAQPAA